MHSESEGRGAGRDFSMRSPLFAPRLLIPNPVKQLRYADASGTDIPLSPRSFSPSKGCKFCVVLVLVAGLPTPPRGARHPSEEGIFQDSGRKNPLLGGVPRRGGVGLLAFEQAIARERNSPAFEGGLSVRFFKVLP